MSTLKYWVWFAERRGLRPDTRGALLERFGNPQGVYFAGEKELQELSLRETELLSLRDKSTESAERILERCTELDVRILTLQDAAYPNRLRNIYDPPSLLYVLGRLPAVDEQAAVAIVGTRKATPYGIKMGRRMGYEITKGGGLVVSGLAEGVDSAGAEGALRAGGSCIGVLGTAIDQVYPRFNRKLFADVQTVGALVSEYPPGAPIQRGTFPRRNRILSGLSVGVVVIEAPEKSGALITAARALEQGRDLFVVPGNVDSPACEGSNALMKDCAKAVTCGGDVLSEYTHLYTGIQPLTGATALIPQEEEPPERTEEPVPRREDTHRETEGRFLKLRVPKGKKEIDKPGERAYIDMQTCLAGLTEQQLKLVSVMKRPSMHIDDIIDESGLPAASVLSEMTMLEISGIVRRENGKRFSLNIQRQ